MHRNSFPKSRLRDWKNLSDCCWNFCQTFVQKIREKRSRLKRSIFGKDRTAVPSDGILRSECSSTVLAGPGQGRLIINYEKTTKTSTESSTTSGFSNVNVQTNSTFLYFATLICSLITILRYQIKINHLIHYNRRGRLAQW